MQCPRFFETQYPIVSSKGSVAAAIVLHRESTQSDRIQSSERYIVSLSLEVNMAIFL